MILTMKQTKTQFQGVVEQNGREVHRSDLMSISEAMKWANDYAVIMRKVGKGQWSVFIQCAIFTSDEQE